MSRTAITTIRSSVLASTAAQSDPTARAAAREKLVAGGNAHPSEEQISAQVSRTAMADYDTGGKYQKVAQAITAAMQGLAGGNLAQAASGAVSPYVAEIIHSQTTDSATGKVNVEANAMAHAVWGAIAAASGNNSALAGAAGAVSGELLGHWIAAEYYPDVKTEELSDEQKSTISALSTLASGLMGGLSGGSSADAVAGAQAGKNAIENNALSFGTGMDSYANAAASWDQYAAANGLTQEQTQEGLNRIATGEGPSWGTTYKVSPVAQAGGDVSFIRGLTLSGTVDDNHISINKGDIYSIGAHGGASIGVSFGPYMPGVIGTPNSDYSFNAGLGLGSVSISAGKDGIGFTFGVGPNWGWSATEIKGVDINCISSDLI